MSTAGTADRALLCGSRQVSRACGVDHAPLGAGTCYYRRMRDPGRSCVENLTAGLESPCKPRAPQ